jgi:hypothetical protein
MKNILGPRDTFPYDRSSVRFIGGVAFTRSVQNDAECLFEGIMNLNDKIFDMMEKRKQSVEKLTEIISLETTTLDKNAYRILRYLSRIMYFDT